MIKKVDLQKKKLENQKIKLNQIVETGRNTTNKNSYFVDKHKLLKVDEVNNSSILNSSIEKIKKLIKKEKINWLYSLILDMEYSINKQYQFF